MMDTIGFLGCGNMGGAIARAVCKAVDPKKVFLANRTAAKAQALAKELGCKTATNAEVAGGVRSDFSGRKAPDDGSAAPAAQVHAGRAPGALRAVQHGGRPFHRPHPGDGR